jgi:hypothetical protein
MLSYPYVFDHHLYQLWSRECNILIDKLDALGKKHVNIGDTTLPIGESYRDEFFDYLEQQKLM